MMKIVSSGRPSVHILHADQMQRAKELQLLKLPSAEWYASLYRPSFNIFYDLPYQINRKEITWSESGEVDIVEG